MGSLLGGAWRPRRGRLPGCRAPSLVCAAALLLLGPSVPRTLAFFGAASSQGPGDVQRPHRASQRTLLAKAVGSTAAHRGHNAAQGQSPGQAQLGSGSLEELGETGPWSVRGCMALVKARAGVRALYCNDAQNTNTADVFGSRGGDKSPRARRPLENEERTLNFNSAVLCMRLAVRRRTDARPWAARQGPPPPGREHWLGSLVPARFFMEATVITRSLEPTTELIPGPGTGHTSGQAPGPVSAVGPCEPVGGPGVVCRQCPVAACRHPGPKKPAWVLSSAASACDIHRTGHKHGGQGGEVPPRGTGPDRPSAAAVVPAISAPSGRGESQCHPGDREA